MHVPYQHSKELMGKSIQGRGKRVLLNTLIDEAVSSTAVCQMTRELEEAEKGGGTWSLITADEAIERMETGSII